VLFTRIQTSILLCYYICKMSFIALEYEKTLDSPFRIYSERHTVIQALGDIKGKSILDVGCGEGLYSRIVKILGAAEVIGIDNYPKIIQYAMQKEQHQSLGIKYQLLDLQTLQKIGEFDAITAVLVLHYAKTKAMLTEYCESISKNLKSGGQVVAVCFNPEFKGITDYSDYYYTIEQRPGVKEGDIVAVRLFYNNSTYEAKFPYYTKVTFESAFTAAGLKNIKWIPLSIAPEGIQKFGVEYWTAFLQDPLTVLITAEKI